MIHLTTIPTLNGDEGVKTQQSRLGYTIQKRTGNIHSNLVFGWDGVECHHFFQEWKKDWNCTPF